MTRIGVVDAKPAPTLNFDVDRERWIAIAGSITVGAARFVALQARTEKTSRKLKLTNSPETGARVAQLKLPDGVTDLIDIDPEGRYLVVERSQREQPFDVLLGN